MLKLVGTILKERYPVEGETYTVCRLACARAYIKAHNLTKIKPTNLLGLISLEREGGDKGETLLGSLVKEGGV